MFSNIRWLRTVLVLSNRPRSTRLSLRCCSRSRRSLLRCLIIVLLAALMLTVMFSSWNVCRPDIDDDVDAQIASAAVSWSTPRRARRPAKICLSPLTEAGVRVNISLDSVTDLQRSVRDVAVDQTVAIVTLSSRISNSRRNKRRMFYFCTLMATHWPWFRRGLMFDVFLQRYVRLSHSRSIGVIAQPAVPKFQLFSHGLKTMVNISPQVILNAVLASDGV